MLRILIESPYAGEVERNKIYLLRALKDSMVYRGEAPFASHAIYTQILDDNIATEREAGIKGGYVWMETCDAVAFYNDYGFSPGMRKAKRKAQHLGKFVVIRKIGKNP